MSPLDWTLLSLHLAAMLFVALVLGHAARRLGISRQQLYRKLDETGNG
jgi:DNA-binding phage protein